MAQSPKKTRKGPLTVELLQKHKIFIHEDDCDVRRLPAHVQALRTTLLDFECSVAQRLEIDCEPDLGSGPSMKHILEKISPAEYDYARPSLERLRKAQAAAERLKKGKDREREWVGFYNEHIFDPLSRHIEITNGDSRRIAREKYYYDFFETACERPWTLFTNKFRAAKQISGLSQPKPDRVAYFPIYNFDCHRDRIANATHRWNWTTRPVEDAVTNFSYNTLKRLSLHGLEPSVSGVFKNGRAHHIHASDCICYPFLVVEHKRLDYRKGKEVICQAANSAAAELIMLRTLVKKAIDKVVPPVVTMTTLGQNASIWVAYFDDKNKEYHMVRIWKGDVSMVLGIINLETILENIHIWAARVLRPWISSYIDQWRYDVDRKLMKTNDPGESSAVESEQYFDAESGTDVEDSDFEEDSSSQLDTHISELIKTENELFLGKIEDLLRPIHDASTPPSSLVTGPQTGSKSIQTDNMPSHEPTGPPPSTQAQIILDVLDALYHLNKSRVDEPSSYKSEVETIRNETISRTREAMAALQSQPPQFSNVRHLLDELLSLKKCLVERCPVDSEFWFESWEKLKRHHSTLWTLYNEGEMTRGETSSVLPPMVLKKYGRTDSGVDIPGDESPPARPYLPGSLPSSPYSVDDGASLFGTPSRRDSTPPSSPLPGPEASSYATLQGSITSERHNLAETSTSREPPPDFGLKSNSAARSPSLPFPFSPKILTGIFSAYFPDSKNSEKPRGGEGQEHAVLSKPADGGSVRSPGSPPTASGIQVEDEIELVKHQEQDQDSLGSNTSNSECSRRVEDDSMPADYLGSKLRAISIDISQAEDQHDHQSETSSCRGDKDQGVYQHGGKEGGFSGDEERDEAEGYVQENKAGGIDGEKDGMIRGGRQRGRGQRGRGQRGREQRCGTRQSARLSGGKPDN